MHVGPDIAARPHVAHDAALARLLEQARQLHAVARQGAVAVDQGVAQHAGAHALACAGQHEVVDGDPGRLVGRRGRQLVFVIDLLRALAARGVAHDGRAARVQERLVRARQRLDDGFHGAPVVAAGRVDDGIGRLRLLDEQCAVIQLALHALHADLGQFGHLLRLAHEARHLVAGAHEARRDGTADETCRTRQKHVHILLPVWLDCCQSHQASMPAFVFRKKQWHDK